MQFDQYAGHCIVSNFWLHRDSHSQILQAVLKILQPVLKMLVSDQLDTLHPALVD